MNPSPCNWVLHDYLQVNGGAERLAATLARGLPGFGLAVSGVYAGFAGTGNLDGVTWQIIGGPPRCLPRIPRALLAFGRGPELMRAAGCVIYSGIYAPLAALHQRHGQRVYYCHTPPRFAFDREDEYLCRFPVVVRPALRLAITRYRRAYLNALQEMDVVVTNSNHVRERLRTQTGVDSKVIYPPIATEYLHHRGQGDYYLSVARLEPLKRVDRIVSAFRAMPDRQLVVTSGGSQLKALKTLASGASNIRFTDWVDDATLEDLLGHAIAAIYIPEEEDFGMSAVEAMAAGKPVIGVNEGGLRESIIDGRTGVLLPSDPAPEAIAFAVERLSSEVAADMRAACQVRAAEFSTERFLASFQSIIDQVSK